VEIFEKYLKQHALHKELVHDMQPDGDLELVIVIPACNEKDYLSQCLASLQQANPIHGSIEILVIVNDGMNPSQDITASNQESVRLIKDFNNSKNPKKKILPVYVDISNSKKPGVGLVRKIGMDEAIRRFLFLSKDGIIVCLDADSTVEKNYFQKIVEGFDAHPKHLAASIYFEHEYKWNKEKIIQYESHLRYFLAMQRRINLPFAIQTVGSSMAVRASGYCKLGGMNIKQAGEDFYFLQKFISNNNCFEINDTAVYPSDRGSERVPFGTGRAVEKLNKEQTELKTYHPDNFYVIKNFIASVFNNYSVAQYEEAQFSHLNTELLSFLIMKDYITMLNQIKSNTSSNEKFKMRFFQWFNAFMLMKCLHSLRDTANRDINISKALELYFGPSLHYVGKDPEQLLNTLRIEAKQFAEFT